MIKIGQNFSEFLLVIIYTNFFYLLIIIINVIFNNVYIYI